MSIPGYTGGQALSALAHAGGTSGFRNAGLGRRLKLAQREDALKRGIRLMEWTFDPLEIKNAFFNIEKPGAILTAIRRIFMVYPRLGSAGWPSYGPAACGVVAGQRTGGRGGCGKTSTAAATLNRAVGALSCPGDAVEGIRRGQRAEAMALQSSEPGRFARRPFRAGWQ